MILSLLNLSRLLITTEIKVFKMSQKKGPYKKYLSTGDSPPKSTKYDHAKKRKDLASDSDSSTDDEEVSSAA